MNLENPYHKEALVAGLAMAVRDFEDCAPSTISPPPTKAERIPGVEVLADWNIAVKHMEAIIDAAVAKVESERGEEE